MQASLPFTQMAIKDPRAMLAAFARSGGFWPAAFALAGVAALLTLLTRPDVYGPIHVDEWTNLAYAEALVADEGGLPHPDPLFDEGEVGFRPETGFRVFLAELHEVTGVRWESLFPALPALLMALFVVTVLALGKSLRTGLFAGVLALGTPTTLRFLGPEFAVPVSLGLIFATALAIILLAPGLDIRARSAIAPLLMGALVLVHPPTALVACVFVAGVGALHYWHDRKSNFQRANIPVVLTLLVPVIWFIALPGDVRSELLGETGAAASEQQGLITNYLSSAGYARVVLMACSLFFLMASGFTAPKVLFLGGVGAGLAFTRAHEMDLVGMANLYDRAWLYLDLLLILGAAAGITAGINMVPKDRLPVSKRALTGITLVALVVVVVTNAVIVRNSQRVYIIGNEQRAEDFRWVRENLSDVPGLTLLNPDIAISYPVIAGRPVFASSAEPRPSPFERIEQARQMLNGAPDVSLLTDLGIAVVYRPDWSEATGVTEVRPGIFVIDAARHAPETAP